MMGDPQKKAAKPADDFIEDDFQPDEESAPINGPLAASPRAPQSKMYQAAQKVLGAAKAPFQRADEAFGNLSKGDIPAGIVGLMNAGAAVPGALTAPLNFIPGAPEAMGALAKPGVEAWKDLRKNMVGELDKNWPDRPRLFSVEAGRQADELGQASMGAATSTMATAGLGGALKGVAAKLPGVADVMTESSFKVPPTFTQKMRGSVVETAQKYGITPTKKGFAKLQTLLGDLETQQTALEDAARANAGRIPLPEVVKSLDALKDKWAQADTPRPLLRIIEGYRQQVLREHPGMAQTLSMDKAIGMKQTLQQQLSGVYQKAERINPSMRNNLLTEAKSAVEKDIRSRLEDMIPGYKDVNNEIHNVINTRDLVERAMNRISNHDLVNLRDIASGGVGRAVTGTNLGAISAAIIQKVLSHPRVWAAMANRIANSSAAKFGASDVSGVAAGGAAGSVLGGADEYGWQQHPDGFEYRVLPEGQ